jgi:hypothetical protein
VLGIAVVAERLLSGRHAYSRAVALPVSSSEPELVAA